MRSATATGLTLLLIGIAGHARARELEGKNLVLEGYVHAFDTREPVAAAEVVLSMDMNPDGLEPTGVVPDPVRIRTDANGRFFAGGLPGGLWRATVRATGFEISAGHEWARPPGSADRGVLHILARPAVTRISGRVLGPDDRPAPGTVVVLEPAVGRNWPLRGFRCVADADGRFLSVPLGAGVFRLLAANGDMGFSRKMIRVHPGLADPLPHDVRLVAGRRIESVVVTAVRDGNGTPIPSAVVSFDEEAGLRTETDDRGRFALLVPGDRTVSLHVDAVGFWNSVVRLEPGRDLDVIRMPRLVDVAGTVYWEETGEPVAGAELFRDARCWPRVWADGQGRFVFRDVPPTRHERFVAMKDGSDVERHVDVASLGGKRILLVLPRPREDRPDPEEDEVTDAPTVMVRGRFVDEEGRPVGGAMFDLQRVGVKAGFGPGRDLRAGADGRWEMRLSRGRRYSLGAGHPAFHSRGVRFEVGDGTSEIRTVLTRREAVRGRVVGPDGAPVAGAIVRESRYEEEWTVTDAEGRWSLRPDPVGGHQSLYLEARHPSCGPARHRVNAAAARKTPPVLRLVPFRPYLGIVRDDLGRPLPGASVIHHGEPEQTFHVSDERGRFTLPGIHAGDARYVEVRKDGYVPPRHPDSEGDAEVFVLTIRTGVRVLLPETPGRTPPGGCELTWEEKTGGRMMGIAFDGDGAAMFQMAAGTYDLRVRAGGWSWQTFSGVAVERGVVRTLRLKAPE